MNATIRLVISASSLPPTSGRRARSSGPGSLLADLVVLCLSVLLTGASSPPFELVRLKRTHGSTPTHCERTRTRSLGCLVFGWDRSSVGRVEVWLRRPPGGAGRGGQASAQSARAPLAAADGGKRGWLRQRPTHHRCFVPRADPNR